jgi:3-demethylubiquinone-9 3-methyltransferase
MKSGIVYPDSLKIREKFLAFSDWTDSVARIIQSGFLGEEDRKALTALARDISMSVSCGTQTEMDGFWEKLSAGGEKGRCGWLKDKFGLSWRIVPPVLGETMQDMDSGRSKLDMSALLRVNKLEIVGLKQVYDGVAT